MPTVWAVSDLHGAVSANSERIDQLTPPDPADWLIVAGDVAERTDLIIRIYYKIFFRCIKQILDDESLIKRFLYTFYPSS